MNRVWWIGWMTLLCAGCTTYQLGSMLPADVRTVYVEPVVNRTEEPLIEVEVMRNVTAELQRDGSLRVVGDAKAADAILRIVLTGYKLQPLAYEADRAVAAEEYKLVLQAAASLQRAQTGALVVELPRVSGESTFVVAGDMTTSKASALPEAVRDLARQIVAGLVEAWP